MAKNTTPDFKPNAKQIRQLESKYKKQYLIHAALGLSPYHYYKYKEGSLHPAIQADVYGKMMDIIGAGC